MKRLAEAGHDDLVARVRIEVSGAVPHDETAARLRSAAYRTAVTGTFEIRTSRSITLRRNIDSIA